MAISTTIAAKAAVNPSRSSARFSRGSSPYFYITGLEAATAPLVVESQVVALRARSITDRAASRIEQAQKQSAPVRSGATRASIQNTVVDHPDGYARSVGPTHFVARFLVFGTVKMSPKWDLFGASQAGIDWWLSEMNQVSTL